MKPSPPLLVLLLAAGCAQTPRQEDTAAAMQDALASHQANMARLGAPADDAPETQAVPMPAMPIPAAATAPAPPGSPGETPALAGGLVGQTPEAVLRWFGEPRLRRSEGPAEIWHYQASQCHLDLVLYRDDAAAPTLRVAFAAARAAGAARRGEAACLSDIARAAPRRAPPGLAGGSGT